jgi:predicted transcriptional regulator
VAFTVRTNDELEHALSELARLEGTSRQEVVQRAVLDRYEMTVHRERVVLTTREMLDRWHDVIERLASA